MAKKSFTEMVLKSLKRFLNDGTKKSSTVMILKRFINDNPKGLKGSQRFLLQGSKRFLLQWYKKVPYSRV